MLQAHRRHMMAETSQECSVYTMSNQNELASWAKWQSNDSEFQTEAAQILKAFADTL